MALCLCNLREARMFLRLLTNPLLLGALGADWALMLQTEVICCRSLDEDFLLEKSDRSPIVRDVHL